MTISVTWKAGTGHAWTGTDIPLLGEPHHVVLHMAGHTYRMSILDAHRLSDELLEAADRAERAQNPVPK